MHPETELNLVFQIGLLRYLSLKFHTCGLENSKWMGSYTGSFEIDGLIDEHSERKRCVSNPTCIPAWLV
jgi:hypothetical protein